MLHNELDVSWGSNVVRSCVKIKCQKKAWDMTQWQSTYLVAYERT